MFTIYDAVLVLAATHTLAAACWDAYLHTGPGTRRHTRLHLSALLAAALVLVLSEGALQLVIPFTLAVTWYLLQLGSDLEAAHRTLSRRRA